MKSILLIESDRDFRETLRVALSQNGYDVYVAVNADSAIEWLLSCAVDIGLIIVDVGLFLKCGEVLYQALERQYPDISLLCIGLNVGVSNCDTPYFLRKPFEIKELLEVLKRFDNISAPHDCIDSECIAESSDMRCVMSLADKVAQIDDTVLIQGETGVGKEVLARYLHRHSKRADAPFVVVSCAAIPEQGGDSFLFGHAASVLPYASAACPSIFESAEGGVLLLDEVADLSLTMQAKLLRVLQTKEIIPLGASPLKLNLRIIATTQHSLPDLIEVGKFRADLYYRLNAVSLIVPPLRERKDDILPLIRYFFLKQGKEYTLTASALRGLTAYSWLGNIRELFNVMRRALIVSSSDMIDLSDLMLPIPADVATSVFVASTTRVRTLETDIRSLEKQHILDTLAAVGGIKKLAAEKLGMSERTLRYKLQRYRSQEEGDGDVD